MHWAEFCERAEEAGGLPRFVKVSPEVPVRQWVCSLPWRQRVRLGYDRLCADVLEAFVVELRRALRRRAKKALGLAARTRAHTGPSLGTTTSYGTPR